MDNGWGQRQMSAKELTQEIERETSAAVMSERASAGTLEGHSLGRGEARQIGQMAAGAEGFVVKNTQTGAGREQAQRMGWQVLDGGQKTGIYSSEQAGNTINNFEARQEIARDEAELEHPQGFVGEESNLQEQERLADDREDLASETGGGLKFVDKIVTTNQEAIAQAIVPEVNKIVNRKSFRPAELMGVYQQGVNKTLGVFNRRIGDRN